MDFVILTNDVAINGRERFEGILNANVSALFDNILEALAKK